jgi:hypothetical protein
MIRKKTPYFIVLALLLLSSLACFLMVQVIGITVFHVNSKEVECPIFDSFLNTSKPFNISIPLLSLWHEQYTIANKGIISMICPSSLFSTDFELAMENRTLLAKSDKVSSLGFTTLIKDCHGEPIARLEQLILSAKVETLPGYTIFFNITSPDSSSLYGYVVGETSFKTNFNVVTPYGKVLAEITKPTLSLTVTINVIDKSNPASDPRILSLIYPVYARKTHDSCNSRYYEAYTSMIITFTLALLLLAWVIYEFSLKKKGDENQNILASENSH